MKLKRYRWIWIVIVIASIAMAVNVFINRAKNFNVHIRDHRRQNIKSGKRDKVTFADAVITEYRSSLDKEIHPSFKENFKLHGNCSAWFIISSYGESIIYIFPSAKPDVLIDYVDVPAQVMLSHGLIDLNNPLTEIHPEQIKANIPEEDAIEYYRSVPSNLAVGGGEDRDSAYIYPDTTLNDFFKVVQLPDDDSLMTFYMDKLTISSSDPMTIQIHKKPMKFVYALKGPLIFSKATNFSRLQDIGRQIGRTIFETDIKDLITTSRSFQRFIGHKKLKPPAEEIALKKKRSEEDPSFSYPLWMFKEDLISLQGEAKKEGISEDYVDELMEVLKTSAITGTLIFYYDSKEAFLIQWLSINALILCILTLTSKIKLNGIPVIRFLVDILSTMHVERIALPAIIFAVNAWVFAVKPTHLDIRYWIIPAFFVMVNLVASVFIHKYVINTPMLEDAEKVRL